MTTQWQQWWFHSSGVSLAITSCLTRCSYSTMTMKWRTTRGAASSSSSFGYQDIESLRESNTTIARRSLLPQNCVGLAAALSSLWIFFFLRPPQLWARWFLMTCVPGEEEEESRGELIITEWHQSHHFLIEPSASDRRRTWSAGRGVMRAAVIAKNLSRVST